LRPVAARRAEYEDSGARASRRPRRDGRLRNLVLRLRPGIRREESESAAAGELLHRAAGRQSLRHDQGGRRGHSNHGLRADGYVVRRRAERSHQEAVTTVGSGPSAVRPRFARWFFEGLPEHEAVGGHHGPTADWWKVMCLTGVDYFS